MNSIRIPTFSFFFFFNDTATTEIYTLSLHDALPIYVGSAIHHQGRSGAYRGDRVRQARTIQGVVERGEEFRRSNGDRKSTRLNSSHVRISYAVFCLKKKIPQHTELFFDLRSVDRYV